MDSAAAAPAFDKVAAKAQLDVLEDALLSFISTLKAEPTTDKRMLATAITEIQKGVMCAGAGIFANKKAY